MINDKWCGSLPVPLHGGIYDQLFGDGMSGQLPGELVLPADFLISAGCVEDLVLGGLELFVAVLDELRDALHGNGCGSECT